MLASMRLCHACMCLARNMHACVWQEISLSMITFNFYLICYLGSRSKKESTHVKAVNGETNAGEMLMFLFLALFSKPTGGKPCSKSPQLDSDGFCLSWRVALETDNVRAWGLEADLIVSQIFFFIKIMISQKLLLSLKTNRMLAKY